MRISKQQYQLLLVGSMVVALVGFALDLALASALPQQLLAYREELAVADLGAADVVFLIIAIPLVMVGIYGWLALLLFWRWARPVSLWSVVGLSLLLPLAGPTVESGWATSLYGVSFAIWGAALGIAYFSPIAEYFEKRS